MKLRVVRIPKEFKKYNYSFYYNFIKSYKDSLFQIDNKSLLALLNIDSNNIVLSFYVIYQILISNDLSPSSLNPKPSNGIELTNPNTKKLLGIYHIHLDSGYVLLWYLRWDEKGHFINFEYIKHPPSNDNYETIIKNIYKRNDDGFNIELNDYFINLYKILNFNINERILNFSKFKKLK